MEINTLNETNYDTMSKTDNDELILTILKSISDLLCDYLGLDQKETDELRHYIDSDCMDVRNDQPDITLPTE